MHTRLHILLPAVALLMFGVQSYLSWQQQHHAQILPRHKAGCFWWSNLPLDSKPLEKSRPFAGQGDMTQCQFEQQAFDRMGPSWLMRLFVFGALPAFLAAISLAHALGKYGVSEVRTFMVSAPLLIALWFYAVGLLIQHWRTNRAETRRQRSPGATLTTGH